MTGSTGLEPESHDQMVPALLTCVLSPLPFPPLILPSCIFSPFPYLLIPRREAKNISANCMAGTHNSVPVLGLEVRTTTHTSLK